MQSLTQRLTRSSAQNKTDIPTTWKARKLDWLQVRVTLSTKHRSLSDVLLTRKIKKKCIKHDVWSSQDFQEVAPKVLILTASNLNRTSVNE